MLYYNIRELEIRMNQLNTTIGISYDHPEYYHDLQKSQPDRHDMLIDLNVISTTFMTQIVLQRMMQKTTKVKGAIVYTLNSQ